NRQRNAEARESEGTRAKAQSLRDGSDHVYRLGRNERQNRTGSEDVDERDERRGDKDGTSEVARRIAALAGKDRDILEAAERAEHHLGEDAETEDGERRHNQAKRVICGESPAA